MEKSIQQSSEVETLKKRLTELEEELQKMRSPLYNLEETYQSSPDIVCAFYLEGTLFYANPQAKAIFDPYREDGSYKNLLELISPRHQKAFPDFLNSIIQSKSIWGYVRVIDRNGEERVLDFVGSLIERNQEPFYIKANCKDVTNTYRYNHWLKTSQDFYSKLFSGYDHQIFIINNANRILNANESTIKLFGISANQISNFNVRTLLEKRKINVDAFISACERAKQANQSQITLKGEQEDTSEFHIEFTIKSDSYYSENVLVVYGRDVTSEKKYEDEVAEKYDEFGTFSEAIRRLFVDEGVEKILEEALEMLSDTTEVRGVCLCKVIKPSGNLQLIQNHRLEIHLLEAALRSNISTDIQEIEKQRFLPLKNEKNEHICNLAIVPIKIDESYDYVYLYELFPERSKIFYLLKMLGIEIGSIITQAKMQRNISQSEARFRTLANNAPSLLKMSDEKGNFVFFSQPWLKFTGRSTEQSRGMGWMQDVHLEDVEKLTNKIQDAFLHQESYETTYRLKREDGEIRWMLEKGMPYFDDQGQFKGVISSTVDITERKLKEERKSQALITEYSESKLKEGLNHSQLLAIMIDNQQKIKYVNQQILNLTGWTREELIQKNIFDIFEHAHSKWNPGLLDSLISTFEGKLHTKNQKEILIRCNTITLNDPEGNLSSLTIVGEDITTEIEMDKKLRETNQNLQELFDTSHDLIGIFDENGKFLFVNSAFEQTLEYSSDEIISKTFWDLVDEDYLEHTKRCLEKVKETNTRITFTTAFSGKLGKLVIAEGILSCHSYNNKILNFKIIVADITEKLRSDRAQNLHYGISKLVEMGTPLQDFYHKLYLYLNNAFSVDSFLIAVKEQDGAISFPFFVNSPHETSTGIHGKEFATYSFTLNRPMFLYEEIIKRIAKSQHISEATPKVWMGVPLIVENKSIGLIVVQSFKSKKDYNKRDLELLSFISGQVAGAILRHQNEQKISNQTARLEAVFESGTHAMWTVSKDYHLSRFNQNFKNKCKNYFHFQPTPLMPIYKPFLNRGKEFFKNWQEKYRLAFRGISQQFEIKLISENSEEHWWEIFLNPVYNSTDEIEEVSGVAHDITQKKLTELELAESEEKFRDIFESLQDVYFRINIDGVIMMVSPSVFELNGESQMEMLGRNVMEFLNRKSILFLLKELLRNGEVKNFESELKHKNGGMRSIISNFRMVYDKEGKPHLVEGIARDITELKRATEEMRQAKELAEKSLEVKKQFLSNMSHEIRTPMNGIIGMIDLLKETPLNEEQKDFVFTIKKSSETLLTILNDILDLSKIEAGKMELRPMPISLRKTIEKLHSLFVQHAASKGTKFTFNIQPSVPDIIFADETRLLQILSNLSSNAIKFTENGVVNINVKSSRKFSKQHIIMFEVQDTGIGIAPENLDLLFKQFSQVEGAYTRKYGGTGLGLAISQELCRLMNGDIGVESEVGVGSTFWFTIETEECLDLEPTNTRGEKTTSISSTFKAPPQVLLVDDNSTNLKVATSILEKAGCKVTRAQSGKKAIEWVMQSNFDVILMDIQMPEMNGVEATQEIRKLKPNLEAPIIAMTAFSMQEEKESFLKAGMDDYLSKPIKAEELIGKVKDWMIKLGKLHLIENKPTAGEKPFKMIEKAMPDFHKSEEKNSLDTFNTQTEEGWLINLDNVKELEKYGGIEMIADTYNEFHDEVIELIKQLDEAIAKGDAKEAKSAMHTIKGTSATLGIERLSKIAKIAEAKLKEGNTQDLDKDARIVKERFKEFSTVYKQILKIP
ncbi:MAG: hypothetical protein OHK0038_00300 [Flammeovirgaceae bacterium]